MTHRDSGEYFYKQINGFADFNQFYQLKWNTTLPEDCWVI